MKKIPVKIIICKSDNSQEPIENFSSKSDQFLVRIYLQRSLFDEQISISSCELSLLQMIILTEIFGLEAKIQEKIHFVKSKLWPRTCVRLA